MEFLKVDSVENAREKLYNSAKGWLPLRRMLPLSEAAGMVLAEDIFTTEDIPAFRRSTVDGYAVVSTDTAAAGESVPVFLTVKDHIEMGKPASAAIGSGECAEIPTGGMLPEGADAVVMVEYAEPFGADGVALYHSAANCENVVQAGEEAKAGSLLLRRGKHLLPQDIGAMAAAGVASVPVYENPRITILSTGDELVSPEMKPLPGQIRDVNTYALAALAERRGFAVVGTDVLTDDEHALERRLLRAMEESDIVAVSGGSSKGKKDVTRLVIERVASPGVYAHGLAIKPGKPTILGYDEASRTIIAGLPGHPVSAMMVFELLIGWLLRKATDTPLPPAIPARLSCNAASSPGKLNCWPVSIEWTNGGYVAEPIFGKSGLITAITSADGYFTVEREAEGMKKGDVVMVHLF